MQSDKGDWTERQLQIWNAIRVWKIIRSQPGVSLYGVEYPMATELEQLGLVFSVTRDDGEDRWFVVK